LPVSSSRFSRGLRYFLRLFTDVREGEEASALLMLLNVFLVLCAYYFVKPMREGWISVSPVPGLSKVEVKAYSSFGQVLLLIPVVWAYSRLSIRWTRSALITRATLFCMANMLIFWAIQPGVFVENLPFTGIAFYLWVGMFGVFVVAQFWSFAADIYSNERGKRMLPMIAIGATAGAAFGSEITGWLLDSGIVDVDALLLLAMVPLSMSIVLTRIVDRRESQSQVEGEAKRSSQSKDNPPETRDAKSKQSGLSVVFSSKFLISVAVVTLLVNWVNTNGENLLFWVVQDFLQSEAQADGLTDPEALLLFTREGTTAFYADFYAIVNWVALILQAFFASRLLKYGGFAAILLILPVVALLSYSAMALIPLLWVVKTMKVAENATDYSLNNTARNVLWLPVRSDWVYKAKPTIDTLFARGGDGLAALTVMVGVQLMAMPTVAFFVLNVGLVILLLGFSLVVVRGHRLLTQESLENATT
jgi:AAA family ATP:ADP antiporter